MKILRVEYPVKKCTKNYFLKACDYPIIGINKAGVCIRHIDQDMISKEIYLPNKEWMSFAKVIVKLD